MPYLTIFWRFDRRASLISLGLNLAGALLEGIGLLMLLPLLSLAGVFSGAEAKPLPVPAGVRALLEGLPVEGRLLLMLGLFVALIAVQAGIQLLRERHSQRQQLRFVDHLRTRLFAGLAQARWRFLAQYHSSEFLSVLTADVNRVGMGISVLLQLFTQLLVFPVYLAVAFELSPPVTGLALLTGALLWALLRKSREAAKQSGVLMSLANQRMFNELQEFLGALKLIKIHGEEAGYQRQFQRAMDQVRAQQLAFNEVRTRSQWAVRIGSALALASLPRRCPLLPAQPPAQLEPLRADTGARWDATQFTQSALSPAAGCFYHWRSWAQAPGLLT